MRTANRFIFPTLPLKKFPQIDAAYFLSSFRRDTLDNGFIRIIAGRARCWLITWITSYYFFCGNLRNLREKILSPKYLLLFIVLFLPVFASAHSAGIDMTKFSRTDVALIYLKLGFDHILPLGLDHILFILSLYLLNPKLKPILFQATVFTIAHSVTLGLAMYGYISPPGHIVEPIIALSIMFVALENVLTDKLRPARIFIVFVFGLIHGMGFASVLTDLGLPEKQFVNALIAFNVGVELGQITVILVAWALVGYWFGKKKWYRQRIVIPLSVVIAAIALYWTIERAFFSV